MTRAISPWVRRVRADIVHHARVTPEPTLGDRIPADAALARKAQERSRVEARERPSAGPLDKHERMVA